MPSATQIEKYQEIASRQGLSLSKDDILFLWSYIGVVIDEELKIYEIEQQSKK